MKILITGIAGFIGFHTAIRFHNEGHTVVGFDNFNSYYDPALKFKRASHLKENYGIECTKLDLRNELGVYKFVESEKPDLVIHLAAMAGVRYSMDHPQEYIDNNVTGSQNLINALELVGVQNVIYASTSCVMHGNPLPWAESDHLYTQINPYGYTKYINESQFHISKVPNAVGLRFFTVYGPWGRPDMALFDFTKNILAGNEITLFNYGNMKRDFTYVDDIVQGINLVANNMTQRDMYNIGYGQQVQLEDFVTAIETSLDVKANRIYGPKHPADATETWSDTTKLQKIGYNPTTPITVGVQNFVNWYLEEYNGR
jgi:UDP-glucuronate 4-epimerase